MNRTAILQQVARLTAIALAFGTPAVALTSGLTASAAAGSTSHHINAPQHSTHLVLASKCCHL